METPPHLFFLASNVRDKRFAADVDNDECVVDDVAAGGRGLFRTMILRLVALGTDDDNGGDDELAALSCSAVNQPFHVSAQRRGHDQNLRPGFLAVRDTLISQRASHFLHTCCTIDIGQQLFSIAGIWV